jgi:hypothetical protein
MEGFWASSDCWAFGMARGLAGLDMSQEIIMVIGFVGVI